MASSSPLSEPPSSPPRSSSRDRSRKRGSYDPSTPRMARASNPPKDLLSTLAFDPAQKHQGRRNPLKEAAPRSLPNSAMLSSSRRRFPLRKAAPRSSPNNATLPSCSRRQSNLPAPLSQEEKGGERKGPTWWPQHRLQDDTKPAPQSAMALTSRNQPRQLPWRKPRRYCTPCRTTPPPMRLTATGRPSSQAKPIGRSSTGSTPQKATLRVALMGC